jgi:hypothetical protein
VSVDLGTIYASVKLDTSGLVTGVEKTKAQIREISKAVASSDAATTLGSRFGEAFRNVGAAAVGLKDTVVGAFDEMGAGFARSFDYIRDFNKNVRETGKTFSMFVTAPIVLGAGLAVRAAREEAQAMESLSRSLEHTGEGGAATLRTMTDLAEAISAQTKYSKYAIAEQIAYAHNLGVTTDRMDEAVHAAIGLAAKYGIDLPAAFKLIGRASQGSTQMLGRYGIVLDQGLSKQEKFNAVLKIGVAGFGLAKKEADSLEGQIEKSKNMVQEAAAAFGEVLMPSVRGVIGAFTGLAKGIRDLPGPFKGLIVALAAVAAGIGPFLYGAAALTTSITTLSASVLPVLAGVFTGPVLIAIAAVVAAIYGLVRLVEYLTRDVAVEARKDADAARAKYEHADQARRLAKEYEELSKKVKLTNAESDRMQTIAKALIEMNPYLLDSYDRETGKIKLKGDALKVTNAEAKRAHDLAVQQEKIALRAVVAQGKIAQKDYERYAKEAETGKSYSPQVESIMKGHRGIFGQWIEGLPEAQRPRLSKTNQYFGVPAVVKKANEAWDKVLAGRAAEAQLKEIESPGGDGEKQEAPSGAGTVALARVAVARTEEQAKEIEARMQRALDLKDFGKAKSLLIELQNVLGNNLPAAYTILAGAESKAADLSLKSAKTEDERKSALADKAQAQIDLDSKLADSKDRSYKAGETYRKAEDAAIKEHQGVLEQQAADAKKLSAEELARNAARYDATIELTRASGDELGALQLEAMKTYATITESTGDAYLAMRLAQAQLKNGVADYYKTLSDAQKASDDEADKESQEEADRLMRLDQSVLDYKLAHDQLGLMSYIQILKAKQSSERQYSDEWFALQSKMDDASAQIADEVISGAREVADDNKSLALDMLTSWLIAFQGMGDAGVAAAKRISAAINELNGVQEKSLIDWKASYQQVLASIRESFVDAMASMIQGTNTFRDTAKQVWDQVLRFVINALLQMALTGKDVFSEMGLSMSEGLGFAIGSAFGPIGGVIGGFLGKLFSFDNPLNDASAVRSGADFSRLFKQGAKSELGNAYPQSPTFAKGGGGATVNHNETIQVTTKIDRVGGIEDLERISEAQAWIITKRLNLAPTRA